MSNVFIVLPCTLHNYYNISISILTLLGATSSPLEEQSSCRHVLIQCILHYTHAHLLVHIIVQSRVQSIVQSPESTFYSYPGGKPFVTGTASKLNDLTSSREEKYFLTSLWMSISVFHR